jgi:hypothetical protein
MSSTQTETIELVPIQPLQAHHPPNSSNVTPVPPRGARALAQELNPASTSQRVFQQESFNAMGKSRKIAVLVLIVGCNFVQVSVIISLLRSSDED